MTKIRTDSEPEAPAGAWAEAPAEAPAEAWAETWSETAFHLIPKSRTVSMIETRTDIPIEIRISIQIKQQVLGFTLIEIRLGIGNDEVRIIEKILEKKLFSVVDFFFNF